MLKQMDKKIEVIALFIVKRFCPCCFPRSVKELSKTPSVDFQKFDIKITTSFSGKEVKKIIQELS